MAKRERAAKPSDVQPAELRRRMVLMSENDLQSMATAFAEGRPATVTVYRPHQGPLTEAQREKRKAYRQRPEVREKQRAYRAARTRRLRGATEVDQTGTGDSIGYSENS
jgi:hypothetical protein